MITCVSSSMGVCDNESKNSRTDLDNHSNMVVVGKKCTVLNETGRHAEVAQFTPDCESLHKVPVICAVIEYDDKHSGETYLLVFYGTFLVPSMDHNLVPPFILRESGLEVDTIPKYYKTSPPIECCLMWK